jgi:NADH dehydrogenase (ubiquinone) 1 alpha subcomplex subunit 9
MQATINALKDDNTIGQTYDLGGPHTYTTQEYYEMLFNICQIKPYVVPVKLERFIEMMRSPSHSSFDRYMAQYYFYPHFMTQEAVDVVCRPEAKGFADLDIMPVSLG